MTEDQVFCMRAPDGEPQWKAIVNGKVVAAEWRDKGSALAGMQVEQRRIDRAEFLRNRPPADAYVLAADRADARTEAADRRTQQRREERLERKP